MKQDDIRDAITRWLVLKVNEECTSLCRQSSAMSPFHTIPIENFSTFNWKDIVADLKQKAPLFFTLLHSIATRNDCRNVVKIGAAHRDLCCCCHPAEREESEDEWSAITYFSSHVFLPCRKVDMSKTHTFTLAFSVGQQKNN